MPPVSPAQTEACVVGLFTRFTGAIWHDLYIVLAPQ